MDLMPTFLEAAGALQNQAEQKPLPYDGRSFLAEIRNKPSSASSRPPIFWAHASGKGVRIGDWKLVSSSRGPWELYNISKDGTELHDLAGKMPDKVTGLATLHADWKQRTILSMKKPGSKKK